MRGYTKISTDIKTLIGQEVHQGYINHQQDREALEAYESDSLTCYFCKKEITADQQINLHHPVYRSRGGTEVEASHESCHRIYHSRKGDFRAWGQMSAQTRRWSFNLKNVKDNPAYDFDRAYYSMLYSK